MSVRTYLVCDSCKRKAFVSKYYPCDINSNSVASFLCEHYMDECLDGISENYCSSEFKYLNDDLMTKEQCMYEDTFKDKK